jgi:hypothetical protein
MINLDNEEVRNHFLTGKPQRNWANGAEEVLFQFKIPKKNSSHENVFELLENAQKPPQPKKKNPKKKILRRRVAIQVELIVRNNRDFSMQEGTGRRQPKLICENN